MAPFWNRKKDEKAEPQAQEIPDDVVTKLISQLLQVGIDGVGPLPSAQKVADKALAKHKSVDKAVEDVVGDHLRAAATGGFVTGLGGFITLPVALPANIIEFYTIVTRMTAAIAALRGYDLSKPEVRSAVLLVLTGSNAHEVLNKVGVGGAGGSAITRLALGKLPAAALMMVNKGVGFQILKSSSTKLLSKLGKGIPVAGGVIGGGMDGWMAKRIADHARREFPQV